MRFSRHAATAALLAVLAAGSGCSDDAGAARTPPKTDAAFVDRGSYATALQRSFDSYQWPADKRPDLADLAAKSGPPPGARIAAGGEKTILEIVNKCAWYLSWNNARTRHDEQAAASALDVMTRVLPTYGTGDPDGQKLATETARRAALGDPGPAMSYVDANCDATRFTAE